MMPIRKETTAARTGRTRSPVVPTLLVLVALAGGSLHADPRAGAAGAPSAAEPGPLPDLFVSAVHQVLGFRPDPAPEPRDAQGYWVVVDVRNEGTTRSTECLTRIHHDGSSVHGLREFRTPSIEPGETRMLTLWLPSLAARVTTEVDVSLEVPEKVETNNRETWDFEWNPVEPLPRTLAGIPRSGSTLPAPGVPVQDAKCTHDGKIAIGGKHGKRAIEGSPEYAVEAAGGVLKTHVEAYASTEGCCCLDEVRVSLRIRLYYRRWYWHRVAAIPGPGLWVWKADAEERAPREVELLINEDAAPPCHFWSFDEDVKVTWDKIAEAFNTPQGHEQNWPPKDVQFEITRMVVQGVLRYKLVPEKGAECPVPAGWQKRTSGPHSKVKHIGGKMPPPIGEKPDEP